MMGAPLNMLRDPASLAKALGVSCNSLYALSRRTPNLYRTEPRPKPNGELRQVTAPSWHLKSVQRRLKDLLFGILPKGVLGTKDPADFARPHVGKLLVVGLDIDDFFPSTHRTKVQEALVRVGCSREVASLVTKLTTRSHCLPQGAPTSSLIAEAVLADLDAELARFCCAHGLVISRYVDNIAISADCDFQALIPTVYELVARHGFRLNGEKQVMWNSGRQEITSLVVNKRISVTREYRESLKLEMKHWCDGRMEMARWRNLLGRINYVGRFHPRLASRLKKQFWDGYARLRHDKGMTTEE